MKYFIVFSLCLIACNPVLEVQSSQNTRPRTPILSSSNLEAIEAYTLDTDLEKMYRALETPLIVIGGVVYQTPQECVCIRNLGGAINYHNYGVDQEFRNYGGNLAFNIGITRFDIENRNYGGEFLMRNFANSNEDRDYGGFSDKRNIEVAYDRRNLGAVNANRRYHNDLAARNFGGNLDFLFTKQYLVTRNFGKDWAKRSYQLDVMERNFGGESISVIVTIGPKCMLLKKNCTTELLNVNPDARKRIYDRFGLQDIQTNSVVIE